MRILEHIMRDLEKPMRDLEYSMRFLEPRYEKFGTAMRDLESLPTRQTKYERFGTKYEIIGSENGLLFLYCTPIHSYLRVSFIFLIHIWLWLNGGKRTIKASF